MIDSTEIDPRSTLMTRAGKGLFPPVSKRVYRELFRLLGLMMTPDRRHRPTRRQRILLATLLSHSSTVVDGSLSPEAVVDWVMECAGGVYLTRSGVERVWEWHRRQYYAPPPEAN